MHEYAIIDDIKAEVIILNIYSISKLGTYIPENTTGNILTKAIKDYKDEYLTGLTDDEREKINQAVRDFLSKVKKGEKVDIAALNQLVASLLKQYGFKGDIDDMTLELIGAIEKEYKEAADRPSADEEAITAYNKLSSALHEHQQAKKEASAPLTGPEKLDPQDAEDRIITQITNNPDGSKNLVVVKNDVIISTCKLTTSGDLIKEDTPAKQKKLSDLDDTHAKDVN